MRTMAGQTRCLRCRLVIFRPSLQIARTLVDSPQQYRVLNISSALLCVNDFYCNRLFHWRDHYWQNVNKATHRFSLAFVCKQEGRKDRSVSVQDTVT